MTITAEELFVRRYDELYSGLNTRDDFDALKLSAILRQLLVDGTALIHRANRHHRLKLRFLVNKQFSASDMPIKPHILFHAEGINPYAILSKDGVERISLERFLSLVMIEVNDNKFTIRDIIKYTANKVGGIHFDEVLDAREHIINDTFTLLDTLALSPLAIAMRSISGVVLQALSPLRQAIVKLPSTIPLIAHYKTPRGGSIYFAGKQWLETDNLNIQIEDGFSWSSVLRIIPQPKSGKRIIYEIGTRKRGAPKFTVLISDNDCLQCLVNLGNSTFLLTQFEGFRSSPIFDRPFYLSCELCLKEEDATLVMYVNNIAVSTDQKVFKKANLMLNRHVIGGSLTGRQCAAFYKSELILVSRCLSSEERRKLAQYLWLEWN